MPKNYIIGIGGTGSRVVESVVHLCAAGYGPAELTIFLVDPDSGNGNLTRTKTLITEYQKCRANLDRIEGNNLFSTDIKIPEKFVWGIFDTKNTTLSDFINYPLMENKNKELSDFVKVLFTEKELALKLDEGFKGHPAIGAVVMANPPEDEYPFKALWDDIADKKPNDVRVFLVGSVFGGTGAAGFPTLGSEKIFKFNPNKNVIVKEDKTNKSNSVSRILLGGALMLPYFSFENDNNVEEGLFVTSNDFPLATKAALHYYDEKNLGFDQIYFIGDSVTQQVGKFSVGTSTQENRSHYIEIVSSLAAFDFFTQPAIKDVPEKMYFTACRETEEINWDSFPFSRDDRNTKDERNKFKRLLTYMTVFSYSLASYGQKILDSKSDNVQQTWYREHFAYKRPEDEKSHNPHHGSNQDHILDMIKFSSKFLIWITSIDDNTNIVRLIDKKKIVSGEIEAGKEVELFDLELNKAFIARILKETPKRDGDLNYFITEGLNEIQPMDKAMTASSRFCNLFYQGSINFCKNIYNIQ